MDHQLTKSLFDSYQEKRLFGRYINAEKVAPLIDDLADGVMVKELGFSVQGRIIYSLTLGNGRHRILMWSQMHGNEATTTRAIFDLVNTLLEGDNDLLMNILERCTIAIVPILNPDGAEVYTRNNSNDIDLNRDALAQTQPESKLLRALFEDFKPHFCFNLHGQRTIFSAGANPYPATVSFLAPTQDSQRSITQNRSVAMALIVAMHDGLQEIIPRCVAKYDDSFNLNCVGDYFQSRGVPTVLFEAGHHPEDYNREYVRYLIFHSLLVALNGIATETIDLSSVDRYSQIPENKKLYYDIILRNATIIRDGALLTTDIAVQFEEQLKEDRIIFRPKIGKIGGLGDFYAHRTINLNGDRAFSYIEGEIIEGIAIDFVKLKNEGLSLIIE